MNQPSLFDNPQTLRAADRNIDPEDQPRLSAQCRTILARLLRGPATNTELAGIALKYTSRISDLRKAGYTVTNRRQSGGVTVYELKQ